MSEMIIAIALLCQVNPSVDSHDQSMSSVHGYQKRCHKKLVECVASGKHGFITKNLPSCIKKGDY